MAQPYRTYIVSLLDDIPFGVTGDYKFRSKNLVYRIGKPFKVGGRSLEEANKKLEKEIGNLMKLNLKENK